MEEKSKAVVLLSGGLDSSTTLYLAREQGHQLYALSVDYGQKNRKELLACRALAEKAGVQEHKLVGVPLSEFGGSSLTTKQQIEQDRNMTEIGGDIPSTYVPARNTVFLSLALSWADVLTAEYIYIGVNAVDVSGYPDCRPEFIQAFEIMANLGTRIGSEQTSDTLKIMTPLMNLDKAEISKTAHALGVPLELTSTCYDPPESYDGCGRCDACLLRKRGFEKAGVIDQLRYQV